MRAIMVMFDSLNRHMIEPYGCDWVKTPNLRRLAEKSVTFENAYVGSMPCMPARREIHTGRYNFLHRSWGPIEPYDDSMPEILKNNGITSHLYTDHYHYWEEGGCNYHTRYSTFDISRGQEGDLWKADLRDTVPEPETLNNRGVRQDWVNRWYQQDEKDTCQAKTFAMGREFIETNHGEDNWFLQIETFDPHEPYFSPDKYKELYPDDWDGPVFDWPSYRKVDESIETPEAVQHMRNMNAALISMCDHYLGTVLDMMDKYEMWDDTMLIINTDHGFLLGEHDWWAKCHIPFYNEIAHTPLFIWDPRSGIQGERRQALVQTIDLAPTLLDYFGVDIPEDMEGVPLKETIVNDTSVREAGLFGLHGAQVNVTDGKYVYMRTCKDKSNTPLFEYTLMPTHMRHTFEVDELQDIQLQEPFSFTKGCRNMKIEARTWKDPYPFGTQLFNIVDDPKQEKPLENAEVEERMIKLMVDLMKKNDAPQEQYERLGLTEYV